MFRKENLVAFSAVLFLIAIAIGYSFGQFVSPELTEGTSGLLGWDVQSENVFNYFIFLIVFSFVMLASPILNFIRKNRVIAFVEVLLILSMMVGGFLLSRNWLISTETESGFLGFNESVKSLFDAGWLLAGLMIFWGIYLIGRFVAQLRKTNQLGTRNGRVKLLLLIVGIIAVCFYFIGMHRDIFSSTKFWFFQDDVSLIDSVTGFFKAGENFLGVIIITFTLIFPMVKFIYMFWGLLAPLTPLGMKISKILSTLGKYSMLDVFVVALLILNLKFDSDIIDMEVRSGAIFFGVSIILNMIVASAVVLMGLDKAKETQAA